jgi:glyoxylase-like metal-dependent hydrolase (beta-lactamase superfamily II)
MRVETIDLNFMGTEEVIASFLLLGTDSAGIVETGPTSCLERLQAGLKANGVPPGDVREVFLTHIHLDHAGASGHLAEILPNATFYVHELGYPHLADPSKLVKSATRIYGERMDELWGEVRPVPEERLVVLGDGEEVETAGGRLVAHDTPTTTWPTWNLTPDRSSPGTWPASASRGSPTSGRPRRRPRSTSMPGCGA